MIAYIKGSLQFSISRSMKVQVVSVYLNIISAKSEPKQVTSPIPGQSPQFQIISGFSFNRPTLLRATCVILTYVLYRINFFYLTKQLKSKTMHHVSNMYSIRKLHSVRIILPYFHDNTNMSRKHMQIVTYSLRRPRQPPPWLHIQLLSFLLLRKSKSCRVLFPPIKLTRPPFLTNVIAGPRDYNLVSYSVASCKTSYYTADIEEERRTI